MTQTPYLGLTLPNFLAAPWHDQVNENFAKLDATLKYLTGLSNLRGPWDNSITVIVGDRYFQDDTSTMYLALVSHTTAPSPVTFAEDRIANPTYWAEVESVDLTGWVTVNGIVLPDGSLGTPALRFDSDTNTGLVFSNVGGNDGIGIVVNGTLQAHISAATILLNQQVTGTAVVSSNRDTTAGRLLKVGSYGLGSTGEQITVLDDATLPAGFYWFLASASGTHPTTPADGFIMVVKSAATSGVQVFIPKDATFMYHRRFTAGVFSPWKTGVPTNITVVANIAALKLLDTTQYTGALVASDGAKGNYVWRLGNYSAQHTAEGGADYWYVKAAAVATTVGIWLRTDLDDNTRRGVWYVEQFGQPGVNNRPQFQAAYDAASAVGGTVIVSGGPWTCATPITLSGTARCTTLIDATASFASPTDLDNAIPEQPNGTGHLWKEVENRTAYVEGSGGYKLISGQLRGTGADGAGQRDFIRVEVQSNSSSSGPSWDGVGATNINRDQIGAAVFNFGTAGQMNQALWGFNSYSYLPPGADGFATGFESNVHLDGQTAVKEMGTKAKYGVMSVSKGDAATAAYVVGGSFFKGVVLTQTSLPSDAASRAFEYTDLFEVMRDGRTMVGKGVSNLFAPGAEAGPDGSLYLTGDNASSLFYGARDDVLAAATVNQITGLLASGLNNASVIKTFAQILMGSLDGGVGSEDGYINFLAIAAGSAVLAQQLRGDLNTIFVPTAITTTVGGLTLPRLTTTQRDAVGSWTDGTQIYNTTTNKFQGRASGTWVDLH